MRDCSEVCAPALIFFENVTGVVESGVDAKTRERRSPPIEALAHKKHMFRFVMETVLFIVTSCHTSHQD